MILEEPLRPRFVARLSCPVDEAMTRLGAALASAENTSCVGRLFVKQVEVTVPDEAQHTWSPYLNLVLREAGDQAQLEGTFGPSPGVWTFFLALYAAFTLSGAAGLIVASSQWMLKQQPTGLVVTGACMVLLAITYGAGITGRQRAHAQMRTIRVWLHGALGDCLIHADADPAASA